MGFSRDRRPGNERHALGSLIPSPLSFQTTNQHPTMTRDLATALLNRAADGTQLLAILETITADLETQGIEDCAQHFAEINAPTADPIAF